MSSQSKCNSIDKFLQGMDLMIVKKSGSPGWNRMAPIQMMYGLR
ncbi:MAG: hypothetical protein ABR999_00395 [Methanoregula sp.]